VIVPETHASGEDPALLKYVTFDAEIGRFLVARSARGLRAVRFAKDLDVERALARETRGGRVIAVEDRLSLKRVVDAIRDYLRGRPVEFDFTLDLQGVTEFSARVLEIVGGIPYGGLRSYKWVAREAGAPRATRPVGQVLSRNPVPIVVPCHRVVQSDGTLGGYSAGGPDMKRRLIALESGQMGLDLTGADAMAPERIRFLLEAEAPDGEDA
jgi:methylated-DNA-[protein]-cysteine S-methyltransferase